MQDLARVGAVHDIVDVMKRGSGRIRGHRNDHRRDLRRDTRGAARALAGWADRSAAFIATVLAVSAVFRARDLHRIRQTRRVREREREDQDAEERHDVTLTYKQPLLNAAFPATTSAANGSRLSAPSERYLGVDEERLDAHATDAAAEEPEAREPVVARFDADGVAGERLPHVNRAVPRELDAR